MVPEAKIAVLEAFWCTRGVPLVAHAILSRQRQPTRIDFEGCSNLPPSVFERLYKRGMGGGVTYLDVKGMVGFTDESLQLVGAACPNLWLLQIGGCTALTDKGIIDYVALIRQQSEVHLRKLSLMNCSALTNAALAAVAEELPEVRDLCIYGCYRMTDDGLIRFKRSSCLRKLNTSGCYKISDMGIRYLMQVKPTVLIYHKPRDFYLPFTPRDLL
ncbi:hypothetical protein T484DRAFT_1929974 [Baffinella frigidus]|nr:hypothetical protein T484DRAFT_1929974 [Cryptophyta sp. CCMP2293]